MTSPNEMSADEFKAQGNAAFAAKDFQKAADLFTQAINASPTPNHVLYSNRSGAYASLKDYKKALADAEETVKINPTWVKGYNRRGAALHGLGEIPEAVEAYDHALKLDPSNTQAQQGKKSAQDALQASGADQFMQLFSDPSAMKRLHENPKTKEYLKDPTFMQKLQDAMRNPLAVLTQGNSDPRMMEAMGVMLGISTENPEAPMPDAPPPQSSTATESQSEPKPKAAKTEPKAEPTPAEPAPEGKAAADAAKARGNDLYKKRQFDEAIAQYEEAWSLHKDITYLNNRAAAEFEKGDYDAAIKTCLVAVEESHELRSDYKAVAKALARIGTCYLKQENLKDAITYFDKSLTEHRSPDVLTKLRNTQRELRQREEQAYINPELGDKARDEGNALFKEGKFPESVKAYSEAVKRNPQDPRGYANRAASFLKLMNYPDVVRDCDKALELDPDFMKAYTRKATAYNIMKQFQKAMATLEEARQHDKDFKHSREIEDLYFKASQARFATLPGETEDERTERLSQDPEIDEIRRDPIMNTILQQAATDPAALRDHMKNPEVARKINLLAAAGIIRTR